ncbi:hypothetical protein TrLO_g9440 [Triparma laevis f. longispina]|uniref:Uncharacterized protein n=1 Tax=Triparma laevis f. longispina TaxID=1714387 RepID=A0A9W6Z926_9STRA|nr:hypothetical protein TrLO_g9440 [Triparma laevis f. longispina]
MNIELFDPFRPPLPSQIEATLIQHSPTRSPSTNKSTSAPLSVLKFNRRGFYLAAGYTDGTVVVWDVLSRCPLRRFASCIGSEEGEEEGGVVSLDWSRDSRTLLAAGDSGGVLAIDLSVTPVEGIQVPAIEGLSSLLKGADVGTIKSAQLKIRQATCALIVTTEGHVFTVDWGKLGKELRRKKRQRKRDGGGRGLDGLKSPLDEEETLDLLKIKVLCNPTPAKKKPKKKAKVAPKADPSSKHMTSDYATAASFDKNGYCVFVTTRDTVVVFGATTNSFKELYRWKVKDSGTHSLIKGICMSPKGSVFALRSRGGKGGERILMFANSCKDGKPTIVFKDAVNTDTLFDDCAFSNDGEHLVAAMFGRAKGVLLLWTADQNSLADTLEGPNMEMTCMAYHPTRSCIATGMADGGIDLWGIPSSWAAFAPDFQALPSNVEYKEREDEFDLDIDVKEESGDAEVEDVEVVTIEKPAVYASDSEDEEKVFSLKMLGFGAEADAKDRLRLLN